MAADYPRIPKHLNVIMESEGELGAVCPWSREKKDLSAEKGGCPHLKEDRSQSRKDGNSVVKESILDVVGNTPMVRCANIAKSEGVKCDLLAKCEFMNPGGAVKDRIGRRMLRDAEVRGTWDDRPFRKGDVIIEPTSGNTGIGLSIAAAVKGYDMVITMPEKMSQEKQDVLKGLGATIVRTPTEYAWDHEGSHISEAYKLRARLNDQFKKEGSSKAAHVLDQYRNPGNGMAHYEETGQEIFDQTKGKITHLIAGAGTGGTITGIARKLKELNPKIVIVGVDPNGSILAQPQTLNDAHPPGSWGQQTEGIGYDFIPRVLDRNVVDHWLKGPDKESFVMARRLLREEGFLCGGSSGTSMDAAVRYIKEQKLGPESTVVVVMPDNLRNYMTKHLNADWMYERGYMTEEECADCFAPKHVLNNDWGQERTVKDLQLHPAFFLTTGTRCVDAINLMRQKGFDQFPVKDETGATYGVLTANNLLTRLGKRQLQLDDPIKRAVVRDLRHVSTDVTLNELVRILNRNSFVLIENKYFLTFSDIFDLMDPKPAWMVTQAEFEEAQRVSTRNMIVTATVAAMTSFVAGALLRQFWKH